jgi:hypothetical protein
MAHNCTHVQSGHQVCAEHMLTKEGLRYRFRKQMQDTIPLDELTVWYEIMTASMLPVEKGAIQLDDRMQGYIDTVAKGVAS